MERNDPRLTIIGKYTRLLLGLDNHPVRYAPGEAPEADEQPEPAKGQDADAA